MHVYTGKTFQSTPSGGKATAEGFNEMGQAMFQSTPSGGKATVFAERYTREFGVSIHAFRGEGDGEAPDQRTVCAGFNPRLPGGRRHGVGDRSACRRRVSIHAFRGEGDVDHLHLPRSADCFNPRLPGGRRLVASTMMFVSALFQSTPSGGKATRREPGLAADR